MGKAIAVLSRTESRRRDNMNISLDDGRQFSFSDQVSTDDVTDPATGREITRVSWTLYSVDGRKLSEGHDAVISYNAKYPYETLVVDAPTAGLRFEQDGAMVPDPAPSPFATIRFNYAEAA